MPDVRYALKNYDKTTTGGVLISTTQGMTHHGQPVGVEGDFATCPACKGGGPVFNDCNPNFGVLGKQILVSGARVYCKCQKRPVVIPSQSDFTIEVVSSANPSRAGDSFGQPLMAGDSTRDGESEYADRYAFIDERSGRPIADAAYAIKRASGAVEHGTTDSAGRPHRLSTTAQAETIAIYLED
ncbi:PAAR domain-containing protein [Ralstonia sp. ASV6]|uniref:PAAR domain-containing protein n=1 Tax=Ralstonia sp. ASV6 TaxID=2795124 RepID=UPI0018EE261D|nr:PAAR domain-containing protein [Ralstonia sp. ASV6]